MYLSFFPYHSNIINALDIIGWLWKFLIAYFRPKSDTVLIFIDRKLLKMGINKNKII